MIPVQQWGNPDDVIAVRKVFLYVKVQRGMMASAGGNSGFVLNFNVGVLGHVDSGKTSLSKALSTVASTASFDKNPQSKERGITLDLGFSSFCVPIPDHLKLKDAAVKKYELLQFTLVDCPGHASLIRTIIGGLYF